MKIKIKFFVATCFLINSLTICSAQVAEKQFSTSSLPAYLKELQQAPPSLEMMDRDPELYKHLMQRRTVLMGALKKAVNENHLPKEILRTLNTNRPFEHNTASPNLNEASSANIHLVKDIDTTTNSNPYNLTYDYMNSFAALNKVVYYSADDGIHGVELWRSDGTEAGTYIVKDINPGSASGNAKNIKIFKGKLYFSAYTDETGWELYQSDGTSNGTVLFKDIFEGSASSNPAQFTVVSGELYFTASYDSQLWKTDGTANGTVMIQDLNLYNSYEISQLTAVNDILFFTADNNNTYSIDLWRSDGTSSGTYVLKNMGTQLYQVFNLTACNNLLYFSKPDQNGQRTLWQSDGTPAGTTIVSNENGIYIWNSFLYSYPERNQPFAIAQNSLFFAGTSGAGIQLYKYNPLDKNGVTLVRKIPHDETHYVFTTESIRAMNDTVYFVLTDSAGAKFNLWKSAGNGTNTKVVRSLPSYISPDNFYAINNNLYFGNNSANGIEPWISDGTFAGTKQLADINPGAYSSRPGNFTFCNNKVFYSAYSAHGNELWLTNANQVTKQVKDINTTTTETGAFLNYGSAIALDAQKLVFTGFQRSTGNELWISNGTESGTFLVKDIVPGETSSNPSFWDSKNGEVYFWIYNSIGSTEDIYVTDGSVSGTKKLTSVQGYITDIKAANNSNVFYTTADYKLWKTDSIGTNLLLDSNVYEIAVAENTCYFSSFSNSYGQELWKSNGTIQGTVLVKDIYPGNISSQPTHLTPLNNRVIFQAFDQMIGTLFVSDGTAAGTMHLGSLYSGLNDGSAILKDKLYFSANNFENGEELYSTDGTPEGTALIKDMDKIYNGSYPKNFTTSGSAVYFTANEVYGNSVELWKTTGTTKTTKLVKHIVYSHYTTLENFTGAGSKLYFMNNDTLWVSDGTDQGTQTVSDAGLDDVNDISYIFGVGNKLFLSCSSYKYGYELYEGDAKLIGNSFANNTIAKKINSPINSLTAQVVSNPFLNDLKIIFNTAKTQRLNISIYNSVGQQMSYKATSVIEGNNLITFNTAGWSHGVYMIHIYSDAGTTILKAVH